MEDSTVPESPNTASRTSLGMYAFGQKERQRFGQNVRLAMGCIEGSSEPVNSKAMPCDEAAIRQRVKVLNQDLTSHHADLLELLVRFDDLQGWKAGGAAHCAAWMNVEIGISPQLGWEYLRAGRSLRSLPTTTALFRAGKLSWSKIRMITRVADKDNEKLLCHAALDASATEVGRLCREYRWKEDDKGEGEKDRALKQWESRALYWDETSNGSTCIKLVLPPEIAQAVLNSIEHSLNQLDDSDNKMSQRRADAAVLMAETSLQSAGREIATADRYQVVVSVDASELAASDLRTSSTETPSSGDSTTDKRHTPSRDHIPSKRPTVKGAGPIALETARRIACDCSISVNKAVNGEPIDIGRRSRIWPAAMARAIKDRDQHCQWPGCSHSQHLQIHHVKHWADGGATRVENALCVCSYHHTLLHEGGCTVQRVKDDERYLNEQFTRQQNVDDISQFDFEKTLRNNRSSFNTVRMLSPTRYRFRVLDANGYDVRNRRNTDDGTSQNKPKNNCAHDSADRSSVRIYGSSVCSTQSAHDSAHHSTRVECNATDHHYDRSRKDDDSTYVGCAEPVAVYYRHATSRRYSTLRRSIIVKPETRNKTKGASSIVSERSARYVTCVREQNIAM